MSTDEIVAKLKRRALPLLKPTSPWDPDLASTITALGNHEHEFVVAGKYVSPPSQLTAALHLANDDLDRCHAIAQRNEGVSTPPYLDRGALLIVDRIRPPTSCTQHCTGARAITGTRNSARSTLSKLIADISWYARTTHPLAKRDAAAFVDACEATEGKGEEDEGLLARQWDEIMEIVQWTRANCVSEALVDV